MMRPFLFTSKTHTSTGVIEDSIREARTIRQLVSREKRSSKERKQARRKISKILLKNAESGQRGRLDKGGDHQRGQV
jgi:hypothetical protein